MLGERGDLGLASCGRCGDLTKARPSPPRWPARRKRWQLDGASTDWIVVRNRLSKIGSRNKQLVASGLKDLSLPLGFRAIDGIAERVVYREFFPRGLTALDDLDEATLGTRPSMGHVSAREVTSLLRDLAPRPQGVRSSPPGGRPNQRLRRRAESPEPPQEGPPEV